MNSVLGSLIGRLISDPTIAGLVHTNIYTSPISDAPQPEYPALTLQYFGGRAERAAPLANLQILISCFSEKSHDECWSVINQVKVLLDRVRGEAGAYSWVTYVRNTPYQDSERTERQVYILHVIYDVELIG